MQGITLHWRVSVDPVPAGAPTVVLVHGYGVSSRYMIPTARLLAPHYYVYAPDLPGWAKSAKPAQVLNIPELAGSLVAWMEAVGLERAAMVGNSMGCQIIADAAVRYPERIERAVLIGPTVDPHNRTAFQQASRILLDVLFEAPSQPFLVAWDYLMFGPRRAWRTGQYALADRIEDKLPHIQVPTLVVRGEYDPIAPQPWADEAARLLPQGRLAVIPGAGHTVNYSAPEKLVRVVRPFLNHQPPAPRKQEV